MNIVVRGRVHNGQVVLAEPLALPDGAPVDVRVSPVHPAGNARREAFERLLFVGMAAGREDLSDSASRVREQREQWQRRAGRQD